MTKQLIQWIDSYLRGTEYVLVNLRVSPENDIVVEVDRMIGVDVDFCANLNRYLVEKIDESGIEDYSLEVGSVSLTAPFKTKMQYYKHLGHDVVVLVAGKKYHGRLVSVDEETFSVEGRNEGMKEGRDEGMKGVTYTWRYDEPKYVKYDLKI